MSNENLTPSPEVDKPAQAVETLNKGSVEPVVLSKELPEKYKGKTIEEIAEMHANAERKISELGTKVAELNKKTLELAVQPPTIQKNENGQEKFYDNPYEYTEQELNGLRQQNQQLAMGMSVLLARQDESMPEWKENEAEILKLVSEKTFLLADKEGWTRTAYDLVMGKKLPEKIKKAEERGKQMETVTQAEIAKTTAADAEVKAPIPQAAPEIKPQDKLQLAKLGKIKWEEYLEDTLSEAELKGRK
jgi:hypothetical protein